MVSSQKQKLAINCYINRRAFSRLTGLVNVFLAEEVDTQRICPSRRGSQKTTDIWRGRRNHGPPFSPPGLTPLARRDSSATRRFCLCRFYMINYAQFFFCINPGDTARPGGAAFCSTASMCACGWRRRGGEAAGRRRKREREPFRGEFLSSMRDPRVFAGLKQKEGRRRHLQLAESHGTGPGSNETDSRSLTSAH